ncbi:hypothetical protein Rsub_09728 [Raphidocelis subcapitata]|uniref:Major facilitator superfamily (MFS) profile domain-containing protein n=1 Tax=Raphidocelis subcapitata TaxID=307507 RepID=A0A2V0PIE7_9CHLO|nr:hypothetical protein Rsub_09728 [Raphidocelis subcapitata]|eukprot:GBF97670.1 hypothetical protein Rsub_09728 [Raphidocelis subcapitata]
MSPRQPREWGSWPPADPVAFSGRGAARSGASDPGGICAPAPRLHGDAAGAGLAAGEGVALARAAERAISWRVLPVLLGCVVVSFIDRTNLSFASLTMNADIGLSQAAYGLGAGAFSLGYAAGQVPSNIALVRFGAPAWLAALCVAWGVTAGAFAWVRSPAGFVALRLLLGLCEAGAIPGVWSVVGQLYPQDRTTLPLVVIESGITVSQVLGAPLAAALLAADGFAGLKGWQLVFLGEAAPALLLAAVAAVLLPANAASARFLSPQQRAALEGEIAAAQRRGGSGGNGDCGGRHRARHGGTGAGAGEAPLAGSKAAGDGGGRGAAPQLSVRTVLAAMRSRIVAYAGAWRILHDTGGSGLLFFTPLIVAALASSGGAVGQPSASVIALWSGFPYLVTSILHVLNGWHSQRTGERRLHLGLCWALGATALLAMPPAIARGPPGAPFALLVLAHVGLNAANGVQTSWVSSFFGSPEERAVGLAAYNTVAQIGGFLGPYLLGALSGDHHYGPALGVLGACLAAAAAMVLALSEPWARGGRWRAERKRTSDDGGGDESEGGVSGDGGDEEAAALLESGHGRPAPHQRGGQPPPPPQQQQQHCIQLGRVT